MYISYFDESGDDGIPGSSDLFILTNLYMCEEDWKDNFEIIRDCRRFLSQRYGFPVKMEFHTNDFLKGKGAYWDYNWLVLERIKIINELLRTLAGLEAKIITVAIDKGNVSSPDTYDVLDKAFTYNLSRVETDLKQQESKGRQRFIIITDEGRVASMTRVARMRQVYNPTTSHFGGMYQFRIKRLIEDPLPKDSKNSFFIQLADLVATIILLYVRKEYNTSCGWSRQLPDELDFEVVENWLERIKTVLNLEASKDSEYGIVYYPKP